MRSSPCICPLGYPGTYQPFPPRREIRARQSYRGQAHGLGERRILWGYIHPCHRPRHDQQPAFAASYYGVFVVELIQLQRSFRIAGTQHAFRPDASAALGFTLYSVIVVLLLCLYSICQAIVDPRFCARDLNNGLKRFYNRCITDRHLLVLFFIIIAFAAPHFPL